MAARRSLRAAHRPPARLARHGWVVFPHLAVRGSGANADHLAIAPGEVFLIDSKNWRGQLVFAPDGTLWRGSYPLPAI